ncbi:hypothetical protein F2Q70_00022511 [Brassica cretica]|uniref:Uncharacterized protein n=1 Tax=Brassica cretica TaxID=69181 RepID=A0A8S9GSP7_BRACR|nr:hypothetical protein F2Q70_00022511 [Brassica cretica]
MRSITRGLKAERIENPEAKNYEDEIRDKLETKSAETTGEEGGSPESKAGDYILRKNEPQSRKPTNHP